MKKIKNYKLFIKESKWGYGDDSESYLNIDIIMKDRDIFKGYHGTLEEVKPFIRDKYSEYNLRFMGEWDYEKEIYSMGAKIDTSQKEQIESIIPNIREGVIVFLNKKMDYKPLDVKVYISK